MDYGTQQVEIAVRQIEDQDARAEGRYMTEWEKLDRKAEIIRECRLDLEADLAKPMWISGERGMPPNRDLKDDYQTVESLDVMEGRP